jgi:hypothetical protein
MNFTANGTTDCAPVTSLPQHEVFKLFLLGSLEPKNTGEFRMKRIWTASLGLLMAAAAASQANASIIYEVFNPSANFVFFIYDSPQFITTDTLGPRFKPRLQQFGSSGHIRRLHYLVPVGSGVCRRADHDRPSPGVPTVQDKFVLAADLGQFGTYQFATGSFGYPNSFLLVAAPEPSSVALLSVALLGFVGLGRRSFRQPR